MKQKEYHQFFGRQKLKHMRRGTEENCPSTIEDIAHKLYELRSDHLEIHPGVRILPYKWDRLAYLLERPSWSYMQGAPTMNLRVLRNDEALREQFSPQDQMHKAMLDFQRTRTFRDSHAENYEEHILREKHRSIDTALARGFRYTRIGGGNRVIPESSMFDALLMFSWLKHSGYQFEVKGFRHSTLDQYNVVINVPSANQDINAQPQYRALIRHVPVLTDRYSHILRWRKMDIKVTDRRKPKEEDIFYTDDDVYSDEQFQSDETRAWDYRHILAMLIAKDCTNIRVFEGKSKAKIIRVVPGPELLPVLLPNPKFAQAMLNTKFFTTRRDYLYREDIIEGERFKIYGKPIHRVKMKRNKSNARTHVLSGRRALTLAEREIFPNIWRAQGKSTWITNDDVETIDTVSKMLYDMMIDFNTLQQEQ